MFEIDRTKFGGFIAELRKEKGITQKELSEEERQQKKKQNRFIYFVCVLISVLEMFGVFQLYSLGFLSGAENLTPMWLVAILSIGFGAYIWLAMKEKLPSYYDENKINVYVDGFFHMNMPGVYYNNKNWPYIVKTLKGWSVVGMILFPIVYILLNNWVSAIGPFSSMILVLVFVLGGLFIPIYVLGRRYEYGDAKRPSNPHVKKDKKKIIGVVLVIVVIVVLTYMFRGGATIGSGSRMMFVSSEGRNYWSATYQYFDGFQQRTLWMEEGDSLDVAVVSDEGQLDIKITDEEGKVILDEKDVETGNFSITVSECITIRVDATKHKGSFSFD